MEVRKQANGNARITCSDSELIDALESYCGKVYENITETSCIQTMTNQHGNVEIVIGDEEE